MNARRRKSVLYKRRGQQTRVRTLWNRPARQRSFRHLTLWSNRVLSRRKIEIPNIRRECPSCVPNATTCASPRPSGERPGPTRRSSRPATTIRDPNTMSSRCSRTPRDASTWAMSATMRWETWSPAIAARAASTCSIRWVGTHSACRRKTPPCRTTPIPRSGPTPTSRRCALNCSRWACRSTGRARSQPATRVITSTSRSCFSTSSRPGSSRARSRR